MRKYLTIDQEDSIIIARNRDHDQTSSFEPIRIIETEIGQSLPDISAFDDITGQHYRRALCLIRLHTCTLGIIELQLDEQELSAARYAEQIWRALGTPIVKHLQEDGLPVVRGLDAAGLPNLSAPKCVTERELFLQTAPFVSIIVATRNRPECLDRCLHSLMALHYPSYEVIIVDNAPTTTVTVDFIQQAYSNEPRIKYVCEERQGLSLARNCGMKVARGEILAFTDDDVVVDAYWLLELVRAISSDEKVACATSLVLPMELETQAQAWFEEFGGFNKGFSRRVFERKAKQGDTPLYPYAAGHFGTGAGMAFRATFLRSIGGFDPALGIGSTPIGGEDLAAFLEVILRGYKLVYEPASFLYHPSQRDYTGLRKQIYNYGMGPMAILMKVVLENPLLLFDLMTKVPYGLFFILSARSPKNRKKSKDYPKELTTLERKGMFYGPLAYLQSRWEMRKLINKTVAVSGKGEE
jgi:GT2 family glycosyltransferase